MGFLSTASTVTVQAFLTKKGREILHQNAGNISGPLISKFAFGDSDTDYNVIEAGHGPLSGATVPEAGEWQPSIRGFAIARGTYAPGTPLIIVNDQDTHIVSTEMLINHAEVSWVEFDIRTEWPSNSPYTETYKLDIVKPQEISDEVFNQLFTVSFIHPKRVRIQYNGAATSLGLSGVATLTQVAGSDFSVVVTGKDTNASTTINVDVRLP